MNENLAANLREFVLIRDNSPPFSKEFKMENMLQKMMKRFPMFIVMGFMIVMIALIIGAVNSANAAQYYAIDKATRDASTEWAQVRAGVESTVV